MSRYYGLIMTIVSLIYNVILANLKVEGLAYKILIVVAIVVNKIFFFIFEEKIEHNDISLGLALISLIFSKDIYIRLYL